MGAHRAIIAASSPVFHAMLYGKTKESKESEICLSSTNADMLQKIFTFIYGGVVQVSSDECLALLQAAHYFDIAALETKCGEVLVSTSDLDYNFSSVITFAVEQQLDLLLTQCLELMEVNAGKVINSSWFNTLPLHMILAFVKSSNLEVREVDLFLAVARWYGHQENVLSADDKKEVFQLIRYPLMSITDLLEKVRPSQLVDQNLYTAALEYSHTHTCKINKSEFSQDQLSVQKYYFNFSPSPGLLIQHTDEGTVITVTNHIELRNEGGNWLCTIAEIYPTKEEPVKFKISNNSQSVIMLGGLFKSLCYESVHSSCVSIPPVSGEHREVEGFIMLKDGAHGYCNLITKLEKGKKHYDEKWVLAIQQNDTCELRVYVKTGTVGTVVIKRL